MQKDEPDEVIDQLKAVMTAAAAKDQNAGFDAECYFYYGKTDSRRYF